ncbi:MAG: hypothetical protein V3S51_05715 [Dehalococcoidia bacterium]
MMRRFARLKVTRSVPALVICLPAPEVTEAYLDPGTGGLILQVGIAAFVGGLFAVKIFWSKIRAFCRSLLIWV